ncbi:MAG: DUF222 domain-containing protein, partial [Aeromicrobium sp.]
AEYSAAEATEFARQANIATIALEIGTASGLSEHQVHRRLTAAERVRDSAPQTWLAFRSGRIDASRVLVISDAIGKLTREDSIVRLDQRVVAYAETHTLTEVRRWLARFVARVEADQHAERAEEERAQRRVHVEHGDDGMAWLSAYLPSYQAAAIDKRLTKEAKALASDDGRNTQQRRADLFASWLTTNESGEPAVGADVAVTISAESLAGVNSDPIVAADGSWVIPTEWIGNLLGHGNVLWHRLITDPAGGTLDHTYLGRFTPEVLTKAIAFRDGVCQAPGCTRSAQECDRDHRNPWPHGPTSGSNLWPLCRRHHKLKSHGSITWHLPSGRQRPAERTAHSPPLGDVSWGEHHLAQILIA